MRHFNNMEFHLLMGTCDLYIVNKYVNLLRFFNDFWFTFVFVNFLICQRKYVTLKFLLNVEGTPDYCNTTFTPYILTCNTHCNETSDSLLLPDFDRPDTSAKQINNCVAFDGPTLWNAFYDVCTAPSLSLFRKNLNHTFSTWPVSTSVVPTIIQDCLMLMFDMP